MIPALPLRLRDEAMVLHFALAAVTPPGSHGTTGSRTVGLSRTGGRAFVGATGSAAWGSRTGGLARGGVTGAVGSRGRTGAI